MPFTLENSTNNVQPFANVQLEIIASGVVQSQYSFVANREGNFILAVTLDQVLEGQTLDFKYTNTDTGQVKVIPFNAPALSTVPLALSFPEQIYSGSDNTYGSYSVFPGVPVSGTLDNPDTSPYASLSRSGKPPTDPLLYELSFPFGVQVGTYVGMISAPGYPNPVTETFEMDWGLAVSLETSPGLRFRGDTHLILVRGEPSTTVTMNVFAQDYQIALDSNGENLYSLTIPATANFGLSDATFSSASVPFTVFLRLRVDNEADYALTANVPSRIITNVQSNSNSEISGLALPDKLVTITITQLGLNLQVTADAFGTYQLLIPTTPWQAGGNFTAEISAIDETTIIATGTHRPDIQFISQIGGAIQGQNAQQFQVRADSDSALTYRISPLVNNDVASTDSEGYATLDFPPIPLETFTPSNLTTTVTYSTGTIYSNFFTTNISERIPLTIVVTNAPQIPLTTNILFVNNTYNIAGNAPTSTGILTLSAVGNLVSFTRDSYENDSYTATLVTGATPTTITITASTVFQPSETETYTVTYPLTLNVPSGKINYDDPPFNVLLDSAPNIPATLQVSYLDSQNKVLFEQTFTVNTDSVGQVSFTFQPENLAGAIEIEFKAFVSANYSLTANRTYQNAINASLVNNQTQADLIAQTDFGSSLSQQSKNLLDNDVHVFSFLVGTFSTNALAQSINRGFYLLGRIGTYPQRGSPEVLRADNPLLVNGFTTFLGYYIVGSMTYTLQHSDSFYLNTQQVTGTQFRLRLIISGQAETFSTINFDSNNFYDICYVYTKEDASNNNNSTIKIFMNGILALTKNFTAIFTYPYNSSLGSVQSINTLTPTYLANDFLLYQRSLSDTEVSNFYENGVRKKSRKSTFADVAKHHFLSIFPSPNGYGYYTSTKTIYGGKDTLFPFDFKNIVEGPNYVEPNNLPPILTDSQNRKYFDFNGSSQSLITRTNEFFAVNFYLVLQRKSINNSKQVFFDHRDQKLIEIAFTGVNEITIRYRKNVGSFEEIKYQNSELATSNILCLNFNFDSTGSEIVTTYLQGVPLNPVSTTTITAPTDLTNLDYITIGSKTEKTNFAEIRFYGYLSFNLKRVMQGFYNMISQGFNNDIELFHAYFFLILGFKEAMLNKDAGFPLLALRDGFYYV